MGATKNAHAQVFTKIASNFWYRHLDNTSYSVDVSIVLSTVT
jgi:hypothetical protein